MASTLGMNSGKRSMSSTTAICVRRIAGDMARDGDAIGGVGHGHFSRRSLMSTRVVSGPGVGSGRPMARGIEHAARPDGRNGIGVETHVEQVPAHSLSMACRSAAVQLAWPLDTLRWDAEGAGERDEVGVAIRGAQHAAAVEALLEIVDDPVALVVHDHPDDGQVVVHGGGQLHRAHEEGAVATDGDDRSAAIGGLGPEGAGHGPAHGFVVVSGDDGLGTGLVVAAQPASPLRRVRQHQGIRWQGLAQLADDTLRA